MSASTGGGALADHDRPRSVLITGGTSGLGFAMAKALAGASHPVVITGRDRRRAQEAAASIGGGVTGIPLDVRDAESVRTGVAEAWGLLDGIDVLVNNAGVGMRLINPRFMTDPSPFWDVPTEAYHEIIETKVTGSFLVARETVRRMLERGSGRIVTVSMSESTMTRRGFFPYGAAGAAVEAFARTMAADLAGTPVRANILLPGGATATGMAPDHARDELLDPAVMGAPIVWLSSAEAAEVHDQRIVAKDFGARRA